jgi:cytochrome P450
VVNGYRVEPGSIVFVLINALHRDPRYWERPDEFWPERFLSDNPCKHKYGFIPFIFGPRVCIGQAFALLEAHLILAMFLGSKKFVLEKNEDEPFRAMITLKAERPIWARVA